MNPRETLMPALCAYRKPEIQLLVIMATCSAKCVDMPISVRNHVFRQRALGLTDAHSEPEERYQETEGAPRTVGERGGGRKTMRAERRKGTRPARFQEGSTREFTCQCLRIWRRVH